jgi:8-oxo-dGTP diphosphatase
MSAGLPQGVVVFIRHGDRYLFIQRAEGKSLAGLWCPVSGAMEPGEGQEDTAIREAAEEVAQPIRPLARLGESPSRDGRWRLHWWLAEADAPLARIHAPREVAGLRWLTLDECRALPDRSAVFLAMLQRVAALSGGG